MNNASKYIDKEIARHPDWRGQTMAEVRRIIRDTVPDVTEEWKWMGTPTWSHNGILCICNAFKDMVKVTFYNGAQLADVDSVFNAELGGNKWRAIKIYEGDKVNASGLKKLLRAAVAFNAAKGTKKKSAKVTAKTTKKAPKAKGTSRASKSRKSATKSKSPPKAKAKSKAKPIKKVVLLSGGNPQIAKADGNAPVKAYIAAMPGWKRAVGKRLDALIVRNVPDVQKAVKWNSPMYGIEGRGLFMGFHVFTHSVKVSFFRGTSLRPVPPGGNAKDARWIDIHEDDLDEAQMSKWVKQAAALPGWVPGQPS